MTMAAQDDKALQSKQMLCDLYELIAALDELKWRYQRLSL